MQQDKKKLKEEYFARTVMGGVYRIRNTVSGSCLLDMTTDITRSRNRFDFAIKTGSCVDKRIEKEWNELGGVTFIFETVETVSKKKDQTASEFAEEVKTLYEMLTDEEG